ncbi:hypothetical protein [Blastopirellula marina]|uniref:hypothetical protein n=1 Tax=Blastopirellula marina TaxID=124 RepID=UPI001039E7A4|nr:hypothetical protein [Blastopirellula marina]
MIFLPTEGDVDSRGSMPWGVVQEDGSYQMRTYDICDGAPAGEYAVLLRWPFDRAAPGDRLRSAFSTVDKSPLTYTVQAGKNQLPPIELTGVKVTPLKKSKPFAMGSE